MPASVPTQAEFDALAARVAALEGNNAPPDQPPAAGDGVQAKRIADMIELFGVNTFSSLDEHNLWGSWPADYRPDQVIAALGWITGNSGFAFRIREYHYESRTEMQREWLGKIRAQIPLTQVSLCVGANGTTNDVPSMLSLASDESCGVAWVEGLNEPNTDFGSGLVPPEQTLAIQRDLWNSDHPYSAVMGPSIVAGMPHPEGWVEGYCGDTLPELNARMLFGNGHYYPPHNPDLIGDGTSLQEYIGGLWSAYNQHPIMLTEFHPSLYNSDGHKPDQPGWDGERDAYYTMLALLRSAKCGVTGLWWYALFDYGSTYQCGLYPVGADNPRPAARVLRSLCDICADPGPDPRTFTPGKLAVAVSGLPEYADWDLYQTSERRFLLSLWQAAAEAQSRNVRAAQVQVAFGAPMHAVKEWDVLSGQAKQSASNAASVTVDLTPGVRMLVIDP